jgi:hypothetical protein
LSSSPRTWLTLSNLSGQRAASIVNLWQDSAASLAIHTPSIETSISSGPPNCNPPTHESGSHQLTRLLPHLVLYCTLPVGAVTLRMERRPLDMSLFPTQRPWQLGALPAAKGMRAPIGSSKTLRALAQISTQRPRSAPLVARPRSAPDALEGSGAGMCSPRRPG